MRNFKDNFKLYFKHKDDRNLIAESFESILIHIK